MRKYALSAALILIVTASVVSAALPQTAPWAVKVPLLDGKLNDACWSKAPTLSGFTVPQKKDAPINATEAKICFDKTAIYIGITCFENNVSAIKAKTTKDGTGSVWADDCIELFIRYGDDDAEYDQLLVNSLAVRDTVHVRSRDGVEFPEKPLWKAAAKVGTDRWTLELAIPYADLGLVNPLSIGETIHLKIGREHYAGGRNGLSVWPAGARYAQGANLAAIQLAGDNIVLDPNLGLRRGEAPRYWTVSKNGNEAFASEGTADEPAIRVAMTGREAKLIQALDLQQGSRYSVSFRAKGDGAGYVRIAPEIESLEISASDDWKTYEASFSPEVKRTGIVIGTGTSKNGDLVIADLRLVPTSDISSQPIADWGNNLKSGLMETYGNFNTMGVILDCPDGYSPDAIGEVQLFSLNSTKPRRLLDPVQVHTYDYYATSVFDLEIDSRQQFRAVFYDKQGKKIAEQDGAGKTRAEPGEPPSAAEIHVSPSGNDGNPGSASRPKQTIRAALKAVTEPATHVVIHGGTYYEAGLYVSRAGLPGKPTVVRAAKGEKAIIDGRDTEMAKGVWKKLGNDLYSKPCDYMPWLVASRDKKTGKVLRMHPMKTLKELKGRYSHDPELTFRKHNIGEAYHFTGKELVVYCPYYSPGKVDIIVAKHKTAFPLNKVHNVVLSDLNLRFFQGDSVSVSDSHDVVIRSCTFEYINTPIGVFRSSERLLVEFCKFYDDCDRWGLLGKSEKGFGYSGKIETGAVYVQQPYDGRGLVIRYNYIKGLFDGAHLTPYGYEPTSRTSETDFHHNEIAAVVDDHLEIDGFSRNVRVFRNRMDKSLSGLSLAQAYHGPTYIIYNYNTGYGKSTGTPVSNYEGYPVKLNGGTSHGTTGWAFFYHNTMATTAKETAAFTVKTAKWRKLVMENNIWYGTRDGFNYWRDNSAPIEMSHDIVWSERGQMLSARRIKAQKPEQASGDFAFLQGAIVVDPMFVNAGKNNYNLKKGSPAIDAGKIIPGINDRSFEGKAPDIGAWEF